MTSPDGTAVSVTASIGIALLSEGARGAAALVPTADSALYDAKKAGGNRVVAATEMALCSDLGDAPPGALCP